MSIKDACEKTAKDLGLPLPIVIKTYKAYWRSVREHIKSLPLKENLSDEEFMKLRPNINIPSIGKLYVTLDRYKRIKKSYNRFEQHVAHKKD